MNTSPDRRSGVKRSTAWVAFSAATALLSGCGQPGSQPAEAGASTAPPRTETVRRESVPTPAAPISPPAGAAGTAAAPEAPAFAVLYPGAELDAPALSASGPDGPGGLVTYRTRADPDAVIAFHRQKAEAAGLSSVMAMNQGEARAYGAAATDVGANLQVVASPTEDGETSVQMSWSAGQ